MIHRERGHQSSMSSDFLFDHGILEAAQRSVKADWDESRGGAAALGREPSPAPGLPQFRWTGTSR